MGPFKAHIRSNPIPPYLMSSVAVDLFSMPEVTYELHKFDTIALCVDRLSGWITAVPCLNKGLTSEKVAKAMFEKWEMFGIPDKVSSDKGPHFAGGWWKTLCALHGVKTAYSQAYHHQANGRAESAGQFVIKKMRQIIAEDGGTWVEKLQRGVRLLNDTPGETGLSPYEICFGRQRPLAHFPVKITHPCEDAQTFFQRIKAQDVQISTKLQKIQGKRAETTNKHRLEQPPLQIGSKVWYKPETQPGHDKTDTYWTGPGTVLRRVGEHSYVVKIKPGVETEAHISQLRPHIEDIYVDKPHPLYYFSGRAPEVPVGPDQWVVERILDHRTDAKLGPQFLVQWEGCEPKDSTWEPLLNFLTPNEAIMGYIQENEVPVDLLDLWETQKP